jgi:hypothetical protein
MWGGMVLYFFTQRYKAEVYKIYDPALQSKSLELTSDSEIDAGVQKSYQNVWTPGDAVRDVAMGGVWGTKLWNVFLLNIQSICW